MDSVLRLIPIKDKDGIFGSGMRVPSILKTNKSVADLRYQLKNAPNALDRIWAAQELSKKKEGRLLSTLLKVRSNDSSGRSTRSV